MRQEVKQRLINTSKSADDFLKSLPSKQFKQVFTKVWDLRKNTRPHDSSKLVGFDNKHRVDIGEYRIIYTFDETIVNVEIIGTRNDNDVYKRAKR